MALPQNPVRRRAFPVGRSVSPCFVGRAFTPAAPPKIQKSMFRPSFFLNQRCGGVKTPPYNARQTFYRRETIGFFDNLKAPPCGGAFRAGTQLFL